MTAPRPPHHEVLGTLLPAVFDGWNAFHDAVVAADGLTPLERNFVWIVVVAAGQVTTGARHVGEFITAGGSVAQVDAAARLGAAVLGSGALEAIAPGWQGAAPTLDLQATYTRDIDAIADAAGIAPRLAHLALAAAHAGRGARPRLRQHVLAARAHGASDQALAHALAVLIMPLGMPAFLTACATWLAMIQAGELPALDGAA